MNPNRGALTWYRSTTAYALAGAVLLFAALPPLDHWLLAWLAPVPWVLLIRKQALPGRRPYCSLWLTGFLLTLAAYHWLVLPHWATSFAWVALALYFGFYLPVFVGVSRIAVHRLGVPVILAAPVAWAGLELARAHLLTGTTMGNLGHTQYHWITLIQISDLAGEYAVGFVVMLVAACLARMLPLEGRPAARWPLGPAAAVLAAVLIYGGVRTAAPSPRAIARIALIQGCIDSELKTDPSMRDRIHTQHRRLSEEALRRWGRVDLIVWSETMFRDPLITYDADPRMPDSFPDCSPAEFRRALEHNDQATREHLRRLAVGLGTPMILGLDRVHFGHDAVRRYNSAVLLDGEGRVAAHYAKMHLVLLGEYVPFVETFPWLQHLTPLPHSLSPGEQPAAFVIETRRQGDKETRRQGEAPSPPPPLPPSPPLTLAPNICYETVLPHVIRRSVTALRARGKEPDVLVNLTNDGWFWGSSELDMHLVCGVFRAVESRKPLLIAANTGFSAVIDGEGRILQRGRRHTTDTLLAEVGPDPRSSWYLSYGDWPAGLCLALFLAVTVFGCWEKFLRPRPAKE